LVSVIQFLSRRWFLLALALVLAISFSFATVLSPVVTHAPRKPLVAAVLFLMALPLDIRTMWRALSRPGAALLATGVNFLVVPLLAWAAAPLLPAELGAGLLIISAIPCTLASAAVWSRRAGGNDA